MRPRDILLIDSRILALKLSNVAVAVSKVKLQVDL